ncbi:MAG: DUF5618 family protein [Chitinivibrionia bacterium]|nr:DUF5618 family protein [Chitinivibrionia bacterium]
MTIQEQNAFLSEEYTEAVRYMDNAKEALQKAKKIDDGYYKDKKYVRAACGIAYLGVLVAIDAWFKIKDVALPSKNKQKSIEYYTTNIAKLDKKMLSLFNTAYDILHLVGYYRGITSVKAISAGFDAAYDVIDKIKPENPVEVKESKAKAAKRILNKMLVSISMMLK